MNGVYDYTYARIEEHEPSCNKILSIKEIQTIRFNNDAMRARLLFIRGGDYFVDDVSNSEHIK